jgi:hypothetical protein
MILFSFPVLSMIYFLRAFMPVPTPEGEPGQRKNFGGLLAGTVVPKVAWIGSSIIAIGLMYALFRLMGTEQMLLVGSSATGGAVLLLIFFLVTGSASRASTMSILYRALPLVLAATYALMNLPPVRP